MFFPRDFYEHLISHTLTGIKGGPERETFLEIWMVEVNQRVFARSWNKSAHSWFTAFEQHGKGQIEYGNRIIDVRGKKLVDDPELSELINQAYMKKYHQKENLFYARGITQPEYEDYTMEFLYDPAK